MAVSASATAIALSPTAVPNDLPPPSPKPSETPASPPVALCGDSPPPPWVTAARHPNDGKPDPRGRIVFGVIYGSDKNGQIVDPVFAIDPDGSDLAQVLECQMERPRFSRDGTHLAFAVKLSDDSWQIATSKADGTNLRVLTSIDPRDQEEKTGTPDWSPGGSWLVWANNHSLWRMNSDGADQQPLDHTPGFDWEPRLSPDGTQVVFLHGDFNKGISEPYILDLASGEQYSTMPWNRRETEHPDWSPDGKWVIYNQLNDLTGEHVEQIERVASDGSSSGPEVLVPASEHFSYKPAYSPDGKSIVFGCNDSLCIADADGSNVSVVLSVPSQSLNHFAWGVVATGT